MRFEVLILAGLLTVAVSVHGQNTNSQSLASEPPDFSRDIQPILQAHCYECHGPRRQRGGLRLNSRAFAFRGGDSAEPGIVPGDSASSHIMRSLIGTDGVKQMPLGSEPLSENEIDLIRRWIEAGAEWHAEENEQNSNDPLLQTDHWSFKPVIKPAIPETRSDAWCRNDIDAFVLQKLGHSELLPTPEADRRRLIRRVFFTLHGLSPTPEQMGRYLNDDREDWYPRMVDELLESPRYGERWARHWLDIVRYAETNGFETNGPRPNAYPYRDYVIRSFNEDKPYDRFILDQLAGDTTGEDAATGFLVAGAKDVVGSPDPALTAMQRSNELADMVNVTSTAFMGMTVACARCHHHKFDPILHRDYYAMEAVFAGVLHGERALPGHQQSPADQVIQQRVAEITAAIDTQAPLASPLGNADNLREPLNPARNVERFTPVRAKYVRIVIESTRDGLDPCIDELEVYSTATANEPLINVALASTGAEASSSSSYEGNPKHQLAHLIDGRYSNDYSWISMPTTTTPWAQVTLAEETQIDRVVWGRDRTMQYTDRLALMYRIEVATKPGDWQMVASSADRASPTDENARLHETEEIKALRMERDRLQTQLSPSRVYAGAFVQPEPTHRLYRGDPSQKREVVAPDTITVFGSLGLESDAPEQDRRVALARSLAQPDHPLTARVMVNRIWQYHFGEGLVATPSDYGTMGAYPTHPELLDYLATAFVESGWSMKHMHRLILNSATFRQDSVPNPSAMRIDSSNRLLWRFAPRRHEAEVIRDTMLQATGKLDLSMYGPGFSLFEPNNNYVRVYEHKRSFGPEDWRRMIYAEQVRMERGLTFGGFDCPDAGQPTPKRSRSTTALQALSLSNSPFVVQQSELFAKRLHKEVGNEPTQQIQRAFVLLFNRGPETDELDACRSFSAEHGLDALCRVLLNTNEFLFIE